MLFAVVSGDDDSANPFPVSDGACSLARSEGRMDGGVLSVGRGVIAPPAA